jgi:hypothetical protein
MLILWPGQPLLRIGVNVTIREHEGRCHTFLPWQFDVSVSKCAYLVLDCEYVSLVLTRALNTCWWFLQVVYIPRLIHLGRIEIPKKPDV